MRKTGEAHAEPLHGARHRLGGPQNSSLRAFAGKALTIVLASFAFTMTTLPKISRFPALVAFFWRVLIITTPRMTNLPLFFASVAAMLARVLQAVPITPLFTSQASASAAVRALLVMTVDFIIGAISAVWVGKQQRCRCLLVCGCGPVLEPKSPGAAWGPKTGHHLRMLWHDEDMLAQPPSLWWGAGA
ncbi:unnamed protein product [Prorocentrum cordatum]|uniref:Uncharacterized protein n=1 Tax=Prorocentrum cordatum TaxID=2364126 RepID=A0ABN9V1P8_9DINO|nr:unnamed protein product [Polarella glacialis]